MRVWFRFDRIFFAFAFAFACVETPCLSAEILRTDGMRYIGQVVDGKAEGQGTETRPDGTIFKGRFSKDAFVEGTMRQGGWVVPFSNCHSPDRTTRATD
ncbi:hypothetical protein QCE62_34655 [Caballeronia sp. LZ033]|nr:hypothetical protein [Caballeronia sp. LZ033]